MSLDDSVAGWKATGGGCCMGNGFPGDSLGLLGSPGANYVNSQACYNFGVSVALPAKFPLSGLERS